MEDKLMKSHSASIGRIAKVFGILTAAIIFIAFYSSNAVTAQPQETPPPSSQKLSPEEIRVRADWHIAMAQVPLPMKGCFQSAYPSREWREVSCTTAPNIPMPPRRGPRPLVVGAGDNISAQAPTGFISTAIGSFDSVNNVTSASSPIGNTGSPVADAYTLQVNTDFFASTVCSGAANPAQCSAWEQFVFYNNGTSGVAFIQYWLIRYNNSCPAGQSWNQFSFTGDPDIYCWKNDSGGAVAVPNQPITNLGQLSLSGAVSATGDAVTFSTGGIVYARAGDNAVNAAAGWQTAEFGVFGAGGSSSGGGALTFNSGAEIVPRTRIFYGGTAPPTCVAQGFTGETNSLGFGLPAPFPTPLGPAVIVREFTGGGQANCAAATTVGDTHLATFGGLFYDFQASGDFVLAQVDPDFVVQARQVSGAPTWPNASVNSAVATRMGKTKVAICLAPTRLNVDGKNTELGDGKSLSTTNGVDIWRRGNVYFIMGPSGDSVRAVVNPTWIDVSVGLGRWPVKVVGLLGNANGDVNKIATRDGAVLTNPFAFEELYHRYADSWRVESGESLLAACGDEKVEHGIPQTTFYAKDLDAKVSERTRAVCVAAGVKGEALLNACTLDVAVIGDDAAAQVFVQAPQPTAVGTVVAAGFAKWWLKWWLWLILIVLILLALLIMRRRGRS
jgi:hypothetical protein